ncbi:MAG TPA: ABC transporter substrate-binding protein [Solirubrobacteraceae bacterium]|nr:ABC transporter substrate-binding protein [Solirubrobacteraceae bacterium]
MSKKLLYLLCMVLACGVFAACGEDEGGGGGDGGGEETGATEGAKVIDVNSMEGATGDVTYCLGKDTSGDKTAAIKRFNEQNPDINAKMLEFSTSADEQRTQFVQRQEAKSGECDVFYADVIWTAEFASQQWIFDMTPYVESRTDELIEATLDTATYDGKVWAMPQQTDAAFLYYRTDQVDEVPATWQEVYEIAGQNDGIVYQGAPYEGLTCDFLEIAYAAGGEILNEAGTEAVINSPENVAALQFMVDGVEDGVAANGVTTYMEEESRRYFESGRATFMRNWPYAYALGEAKGSKVKGKFAVAPFPEFEGAGKAAILGGHNHVISVFSDNAGAALKLVDFLSTEEEQVIMFRDYSLAPTLASAYDDPGVQKKYDFATELKDSVGQARARPVSPVYPQISQAIYKNVNEALAGRATPEEALETAQNEMQQALETF